MSKSCMNKRQTLARILGPIHAALQKIQYGSFLNVKLHISMSPATKSK